MSLTAEGTIFSVKSFAKDAEMVAAVILALGALDMLKRLTLFEILGKARRRVRCEVRRRNGRAKSMHSREAGYHRVFRGYAV